MGGTPGRCTCDVGRGCGRPPVRCGSGAFCVAATGFAIQGVCLLVLDPPILQVHQPAIPPATCLRAPALAEENLSSWWARVVPLWVMWVHRGPWVQVSCGLMGSRGTARRKLDHSADQAGGQGAGRGFSPG